MIAYLSIIYDEGDPSTYEGFKLQMGDYTTIINSGDPSVDYITVGMIAYTKAGGKIPVMGASSIDHFVMDGGELETEDYTPDQIEQARKNALEHLGMSIPEA